MHDPCRLTFLAAPVHPGLYYIKQLEACLGQLDLHIPAVRNTGFLTSAATRQAHRKIMKQPPAAAAAEAAAAAAAEHAPVAPWSGAAAVAAAAMKASSLASFTDPAAEGWRLGSVMPGEEVWNNLCILHTSIPPYFHTSILPYLHTSCCCPLYSTDGNIVGEPVLLEVVPLRPQLTVMTAFLGVHADEVHHNSSSSPALPASLVMGERQWIGLLLEIREGVRGLKLHVQAEHDQGQGQLVGMNTLWGQCGVKICELC
jgi:hypothetical protein